MKITIIGAGNIGGAIARGLAKGHMFKASDITCTAQSDATLEKIIILQTISAILFRLSFALLCCNLLQA